MSFRERATTETSATMARALAAWSDHSSQELQSLRLALQAATDAAEAALADVGREPQTADVAALIDALTAAARSETEEAAARVAADAQTQVDALRKDLQAKIDDQRKQLQAKADEQAKLTDALKEVRAEAYSVRAELGQRVEEIKAIRAELARAESAQARLEEARQHAEAQVKLAQAEAEARLTEAHGRAQAQIEAERQRGQSMVGAIADEKRALEQQLKSLGEDLELSRLEAEDITKQLETEAAERAKLAATLGRSHSQLDRAQNALKEQLEAAKAVEAALRQELATAREQASLAVADAETLRADQELQAHSQPVRPIAQPFDRLLNAFQRLEQSRSVRDVLAAVVDGLASEFARVAVFEVNNNHLEILRQLGFDSDRDMSKVAIPLGIESLLTDAVTTGRIQSLSGPELAENNRPLFGGAPSFILVLPIAVGDDVLAVVYADDSDPSRTEPSVPQNQVKFAQLLLWHAVPRLPRLIREERERADVLDYATHLVRQIQESYDADAQTGRQGDELTKRLTENVKCARQMFEGRAGDLEGADMLFDERLTALFEEVRTTPFGKDLSTATGRRAGRDRAKAARQVS